ncbi:hypothetical protein HLB42_08915 [Deinococcus sp. D7000]|nr:hypothetical protein HLB42_08915 [Deinococcus sp. D7000]
MIPSTEAAVFFAQFAGRHTFQTFDDRPNKDARLSRVLHDPAELAALNRQGAGVFLMVNEGDGAGRKNSNVTRVRAYFADFDGQPLPARWPLEPSMLVESSPSKFHAYWIFEDSQTLPLDGSAFNAQQEAIARAVGSCPDDCKGLSRVMRLPGFLHQKGEPFMTRILSSTGQRYSLSQIQTAFPLPIVQVSPPNPSLCRTQGERAASLSAVRRKYALSTLHSLADELSQAVEGERNKNLNAAAYRLGQLIGGGHLDLERAQSVLWRAAAAVGLPDSEIQRVLPRALTDGQAEPDLLENVGQNGQKDTDGGEKKERSSASSRVMDYAREDGAELWHDQSGAAYLTATVKGHREHYRLPSTSARDYLQALFYNREQRPLSLQAQGEAVAVMQALARREGEEHRTAVRLIHLEGFTYLDLGTPTWEAVEIGLGYWKVIGPHDCPVRFTRPAGLLPLPTPEHGGSLTELREYLNTDDKGFLMCLAWALGALSGVSPFPVLALSGEQGTGKSTAATVLQNLIDPHEADRRRAPKEERDLFIAAQAAHVLCYDNLSSIQGWLSDGLCVLSTGGAFTTRTLYSDGDETILKAVRPVIINGIPDLLARPDLAERALTVTLYRIPLAA